MTQYGFPKNLIDSLECLCGKGDLSLSVDKGDEAMIVDGELRCSCSRAYEVREGIVSIFPIQQAVGVEKETEKEMEVRDNQAPAYDARLHGRFDKEVRPTLRALGDACGKKVIEYGSGTGRLTLSIKEAQNILAIDVSRESLLLLVRKLEAENKTNVGLVWADVVTLPIKKGFFDLALSAQVYEHIPTRAERFRFLYGAKRALKENGALILSAYHFDLRRKLNNKPAEGHHSSGIFFHYFTKEEMANEMSAIFPGALISYIDISVPVLGRIGRILGIEGAISHVLGYIPFLRKFAHIILVKAESDQYPVVSHSSSFVLPDILKKYWFWFYPPFEVGSAAMTNFFSYEDAEASGFQKRAGLTTVIDLAKPIEELWSSMRESFIRKQIEKGERNGIKVSQSFNFYEFKRLYKRFRREAGLHEDRIDIFKKRSIIFSSYYEGKLIAGGLFISDGVHMRAYALASLRETDQGRMREITGQANRMIIWEAVKFAKESGHELFDLGGISPESENSHLRSLAEFKEAFGGERRNNYYYYKVYSPILRLYMRMRGFKNI